MLPYAQKDWMSEKDRFSSVYLNGVASFLAFAKEKNEGLTTCPCPCNLCQNEKRATFAVVERHLIMNGMDISYTKWVFHGENETEQREVEKVGEENASYEGVGNFVDVSYGLHEAGPSNIHEGGNTEMGAFEEPNFSVHDLSKKYKEYKTKAEEKLYPSCEGPDTTLSVIIELQAVKKQFSWSGDGMTVLLSKMKRWFPKGNTLPENYPAMKKNLKDLGMKDKRIDVCENNCILFWKDNEFAIECPKCKSPRYKEVVGKQGKHERKEAKKVLRHFPLIPRLKRLYTIPWIAHEMTWHDRAIRSPDYMRHPVDSEQWRICKLKWEEFSSKKRNVWLAIATDGFNPHGGKSASYSCWPVILVTYNLPPSMCMKPEFQMMSLLIPGPKAPGQDIDVFLEPLVDELIYLWDVGEQAFDMSIKEPFRLRAMLMWGVHDLPAYGNLSGCVTHGYKACPVCGDQTPSIRLPSAKKTIYVDFCMFLTMDHPFRSGKYLGLKSVETRTPPLRLNGQEILRKLTYVNYIPGKILKNSKRARVDVNEIDNGEEDDETTTKAWNKKSILFKLPYWPHHDVRHVIDVMHVEKNVAEHIINTILDRSQKSKDQKAKDLEGERKDMKEVGVLSGPWMHGSFVLDNEEKRHFMQILKNLKLPIDFSSNLSNIVALDPLRLQPMKSHDYHVILQYLLPVLLQHAFPKHPDLRRALHQISLFFYILCSKVLDRQAIIVAHDMVVEALVVLQKHFPPSFFDISIHLMVHLAEEALKCGPVPERWMYPFERAMKECKNIPSNKRYVEGSIAESYLVSESVLYAMEYMPNPREGNHNSSREAFLGEDSEYSDEGPLLDGKKITLDGNQFIQIRRWVLFSLDVEGRDEYYSEYRQSLEADIRGKRREIPKTEVEIQTSFIVWLYKKLLDVGDTSSMLWRLVEGPMFRAKTYKKYRSNGFIFSTKSHEDTVKTQNSGVCMKAITTFQSSRKDKNPVDAWMMYYGVIKEIIEVNYMDFTTVVFYCDWARFEDKTNGCKICPDSNLVMVNLSRLKNTGKDVDEPAILSYEASQVFYSKDLKHPDWWVVIHSPRRLTREVDNIEKPSSFQDIIEDQPNLKPLLECRH